MEENVFSSFTQPLTKSGNSSLVYPPPWIYSVDYIASHVYFKRESLEDLVPYPLEVVDGEGWIYIADFLSVSGNRWDLLYEQPQMTQYKEGAIVIKVKFNGNTYTYFPFMWVDKDWSLMRGLIMGYPKKLAEISLSKFNSLLKEYDGPREGITYGGYVSRNGNLIIKLKVTLEEKSDSVPISKFGPVVGFRRFPVAGEGTEVYELVQVIKSDSRYEDIWRGKAEIVINGSLNDELNLLKIEKVINGYYYRSYFKNTGTKVLYKIK